MVRYTPRFTLTINNKRLILCLLNGPHHLHIIHETLLRAIAIIRPTQTLDWPHIICRFSCVVRCSYKRRIQPHQQYMGPYAGPGGYVFDRRRNIIWYGINLTFIAKQLWCCSVVPFGIYQLYCRSLYDDAFASSGLFEYVCRHATSIFTCFTQLYMWTDKESLLRIWSFSSKIPKKLIDHPRSFYFHKHTRTNPSDFTFNPWLAAL